MKTASRRIASLARFVPKGLSGLWDPQQLRRRVARSGTDRPYLLASRLSKQPEATVGFRRSGACADSVLPGPHAGRLTRAPLSPLHDL
jgi:hypothetical protein